ESHSLAAPPAERRVVLERSSSCDQPIRDRRAELEEGNGEYGRPEAASPWGAWRALVGERFSRRLLRLHLFVRYGRSTRWAGGIPVHAGRRQAVRLRGRTDDSRL